MNFLLKLIAYIIGSLPSSVIKKFADFLAFLAFDVLRFRRKLALSNIEKALNGKRPKEEFESIARASYRNFTYTIFEFLRSTRRDIAANISFEGRELVEESLAERKGIYVLCCHFGNWEAMGAAVTRNIVPAHIIVKTVGGKGVNDFVAETRKRNGFLTIKRQQKGDVLRQIIKAMQLGQIVGFVLDQYRPGDAIVPFFGHQTRTNTSLAKFWRKSPCPVMPGYIVREDFEKHRVVFKPRVDKALSATMSDEEITLAFNHHLESVISSCPEQYLWLHKRWK